MTIGGSIFLIAVGAILRYAVQDEIDAVNLETIGLILMIAGIVGLLIGLFLMTQTRNRGDVVVERERPVEYERRDPPPR
jgi:uncharacterized membrane protein